MKDNTQVKKYKDYKDHFRGETPLEISELSKENYTYISMFLNEVKKRSDGSYRNCKSVIKEFFSYLDKPVESIDILDVIGFFDNVVNLKECKKSYKNVRRSLLKSFFDYVAKILIKQKIKYHNPVPDRKLYSFSGEEIEVVKHKDKKKKKLSKSELTTILEYVLKNMKEWVFFFVAIGIFSGARLMEILSIKIENINFEERYFETGFEMNSRKSTQGTNEYNKNALLFFFPKSFSPYLKNYVLRLKKSGQIWLFPSPTSKAEFRTRTGSIVTRIRTRTNIFFTYHYFRHSLISYLADNGCPDSIQESLLNHSPSSIQARIYREKSLEVKRSDYDLFFPYYDLPFFKK